MMADTSVLMGTPIQWVNPQDARGSRLIEAINAESELTAGSFAYDTPPHPEDVGVDLTREERMMLIRMVDLGGQYYSRRNVPGGFSPYSTGSSY